MKGRLSRTQSGEHLPRHAIFRKQELWGGHLWDMAVVAMEI